MVLNAELSENCEHGEEIEVIASVSFNFVLYFSALFK
jgi:hypothetical protein